MPAEKKSIAEILQARIQASGPIPFSEFMETALYGPELGYYRRTRDPFGKRGDFFTAEQLAPFGELMASFVEANVGRGSVIELGAGRRDLQPYLAPWFYRGLDWDDLDLPPEHTGVVIANEFFDAQPVDLLRKNGAGWSRMMVAVGPDGFVMEDQPLDSPDLLGYAERYSPYVEAGCLLEASLDAADWMERVAASLMAGVFLILDYGYGAKELKRFPEGTLMSYRHHIASGQVLRSTGDADITAHVNFTELMRLARGYGFAVEFDGTLREWALSVWSEDQLAERWKERDLRWRLQWKQLVFGMGETFRVLLLKK